ncbi:MAG: ferrochelatase [Bacteroidales bacterium]|nr:ferrochelatase [Bacteroidales bacterium]
MKQAVLLINIGTPDSPDVADVQRFLSTYLNDPHVIMMPRIWRKLLVNGVIVPCRAPKSARAYRQLWTENGSPLRYYLGALRRQLQEQAEGEIDVWAAMRHGNRNIAEVMNSMRKEGYDRLTVIPLFPQYSLSTTGTIEDCVRQQLLRWDTHPQVDFARQFYFYPPFLNVWKNNILKCHPERYDKVVFSFHGLPMNHLPAACRAACRVGQTCPCPSYSGEDKGSFVARPCYKASCYDFAVRLAGLAALSTDRYTVTFQSRIYKGWLQPYTDRVLKDLASKRMNVLIVAPSFVSDCLETKIELESEYRKLFLEHGGQAYSCTEALNVQQEWIEALQLLISGLTVEK